MLHHPFRFGLLGESVRTRDDLVCTARRAEAAGCSTFLIRDHFIEEPFGHQLAPMPALATVAALTNTLRIGNLVIANDYRHPVMLAKEAATLDVLSGGRFELGLGAGFSHAEYAAAGMAFPSPGTRVSRLAEAIQVIKNVFRGDAFSFTGTHYTIDNLESFPAPVQRPHPPILVGAAGRRMLELAAREADIIGVLTVSTAGGVITDSPAVRSPEAVAEQIGWVRAAAGARFAQIELSIVARFVVTDRPEQEAETLARKRGWHGVSAAEVLAMPSILIGSVEQVAETMHARRDRFGFSYYVAADGQLDTVAPVIARVAGA